MTWSRRPLPVAERLHRRTEKSDNGCWLWRGYLKPNGYGTIGRNGASAYTHRVAWEVANGPVPDGMMVLHRCDVRNCVRAEHLFLGTCQDNHDDMDAKGRRVIGDRRGEINGATHLSMNDVIDIRTLEAFGASRKRLAAEFGLSKSGLHGILTRVTWRHVP